MAAVLPFGLYHRIRSQRTGEKLDRRQEGLAILLTLRPAGLAAMLGLVAFVVNPALMAWSSVPLPVSLRWGGLALGAVGGALLVWTFRALGTNITDTVVTRRAHALVTTGPYRIVRHPFYVASALAIIANTLATANWFIGVMGAVVTTLLVIRTTREEEHLVRRFGEEYLRYTKETGRFVPRSAALSRRPAA